MQTAAFTFSPVFAPHTVLRRSTRSPAPQRSALVVRAAQKDNSFDAAAKNAVAAAAAAALILAAPLASDASIIFLGRMDNVMDSSANFTPNAGSAQRKQLQEITKENPKEANVEPSEAAQNSSRDTPTDRLEAFQPYVPEDVKAQRGAEFQSLVGKRPGAGTPGDVAAQRDPTKKNATADKF